MNDLFSMLTEEEKQQIRWYAEGYGDAIKEINEKTEEAYAHGWTDAEAEYRKLMPTVACHCKDCKHRILNENYGKKGNYCLKAICELDTGDPFELGRMAENDNWYCADAERREEND